MKKLKLEQFLTELSVCHPTLKYTSGYTSRNKRLHVKDTITNLEYYCSPSNLFRKGYPTIKSSSDKTAHFKYLLQQKQPELIVISKYISAKAVIVVEDKLGIKYNAIPDKLLTGDTPTIHIAISKNDCFIRHANHKHNNKYDYSKADYIDSKNKIIIICPIHGEFLQTPSSHLFKNGCPKCKADGCAIRNSSNTKDFIDKAKIIHKDKYDYSNVEYVNAIDKVDIICPKHGLFHQAPSHHLSGKGCKLCGIEYNSKLFSHTTEQYITKANLVHNNKYSYPNLDYKHNKNTIDILCPIHGIFSQVASNHTRGNGCPECSLKRGFSRTEWVYFCSNKKCSSPLLYAINLYGNGESFIKIGITSASVKTRFSGQKKMPYNYKVLQSINGTPEEIFNLELKLLKTFSNNKYLPLLDFKGKTECFTMNCIDELSKLL